MGKLLQASAVCPFPSQLSLTLKQDDLLREIYRKDEADRYNRLSAMFNETRGRHTITLNSANIEARLVSLGLESLYINPETKIRERRRVGGTKKRGRQDTVEEVDMRSIPTANLTEQQQDNLMNQIEMVRGHDSMLRHDSGDEDDAIVGDDTHPDMYGGDSGPNGMPGGAGGGIHHSERVARQACEEIMKTQLLGDH
jgi:hypothetical protein